MSLEPFLDLFLRYGYWIIFAGILLDMPGRESGSEPVGRLERS